MVFLATVASIHHNRPLHELNYAAYVLQTGLVVLLSWIGESNRAGEEFLELCAINQLTVMNTWFKKDVHLGSWMHPSSYEEIPHD